jgi:hypothetical protein
MSEHEHKWRVTVSGSVDKLGEWWDANGPPGGGPFITVSRCRCGAWKQETVWSVQGRPFRTQTDVRLP